MTRTVAASWAWGAVAAITSACASHIELPRVAPGHPVDIPLPPLVVQAPTPVTPPARPVELSASIIASIDAAVGEAIAAKKIPGCVVVIGRHDSVLLSRAYGSRAVRPAAVPMTLDTVFDLASLTKPVATASSMMVLHDRGEIDLDAPIGVYIPELAAQGRGTIRQVLTHVAGFVSDTPIVDYAGGMDEVVARIARTPLRSEPGATLRYSDVGFILLGEVVRRVSGKDLAAFARDEVFTRLGMTETSFLPTATLRQRAAPTENVEGRWLQGEVHDPRSRGIGGVAGHAGLFSTGDDLRRFAQAMLGAAPGFLSPRAMQELTARHAVPGGVRALGWDVSSPFSTNRGGSLSPRAFGHGGFTGTSIWVDPEKDLFVVVLSNRVHPDGHGAVNPLAAAITDMAASAVGPDERRVPAPCDVAGSSPVLTGLDVLARDGFSRVAGAHVGLITNAAGVSRDGARDIDLLAAAPGVTVVSIFAPEHGLGADEDAKIQDGRDARTGAPVYSLFGDRFAPGDAELAGVDTLVVDLQDVGTRFYTYASTMHRALQVAAARGLRFVVLDRPDPIDGIHVEGPPFSGKTSFVNHAALPVRHGMTMGELALLLDAREHLGASLDVVRASGWSREQAWPTTGLAWVAPSPNLRTPAEALLYPGVGLLEGTNVSVGRGTDTPFEVVGAPWMDGAKVTAALAHVKLEGVRVEPTRFTPTASRYQGVPCAGVRVTVTDPSLFSPVALGVELAVALRHAYPSAWDMRGFAALLGSEPAFAAVQRGAGGAEVEATWGRSLARFMAEREKNLLYAPRACEPAAAPVKP